MSEDLITPEFIERLKSADDRWKDVDFAIKIDEELRNSPLIKLVLDVAAEEAAAALEELANVDPTDIKSVTSLQAKVYRAKLIGRTLQMTRDKGNIAYESLKDQGHINPKDYGESNE